MNCKSGHVRALASVTILTLTQGQTFAVHQPQTAKQSAQHKFQGEAFVRKSALFGVDGMLTIQIPCPSLTPMCDQNQWHFTARDLECGVKCRGPVAARIFAASQSLKTVLMVEIWSPHARLNLALISSKSAQACASLCITVERTM